MNFVQTIHGNMSHPKRLEKLEARYYRLLEEVNNDPTNERLLKKFNRLRARLNEINPDKSY